MRLADVARPWLLGLGLAACTGEGPHVPRRLLVEARAQDGSAVAPLYVWLTDSREVTSYLRCPGGTSGEALVCTHGQVRLDTPEVSGLLTVKARGYNFLDGTVGELLGDGSVAQLTLAPLPEAKQTGDYATGLQPTDSALFASLAVPDSSDLGHLQSLKFYIAGLDEQPVVYFQNTRRFPFHFEFARDVLGVTGSPQAFAAATYRGEQRKAMAATVTRYAELSVKVDDGSTISAPYVLEFFGSDDLSAELAIRGHQLVEERLGPSNLGGTVGRLVYVPAGESQLEQTQAARAAFASRGIPWAPSSALYAGVRQQFLNPGVAYGTLRLMSPEQLARSVPSYRDLLVLSRLPNDLPLVGGTITAEPQTPLAHVNLLAHARGTPNLSLRDAPEDPRVAPYLGKLVRFEVTETSFSIAPASLQEAEAFWASRSPPRYTPERDVEFSGLPRFEELHFDDYVRVGSKAANLGELRRLLGDTAPAGFAVPFSAYQAHLQDNPVTAEGCEAAGSACRASERSAASCEDAGVRCQQAAAAGASLEEYRVSLLEDESFLSDSVLRDASLATLRYLIENSPVPATFGAQLDARVAELFGEAKVKLRSSTNVEDLADFNGAGLYESYPATASGELRASSVVRRVWSSAWTFAAFEERAWWNVDQALVAMGVAVNPAVSDEAANGVIVTGGVPPCGSGQCYVNVQLGEVSVTNPTDGAVAEAYCVIPASEHAVQERVLSYSTLSPERSLLSAAEVSELEATTQQILSAFAPLYGTAPSETYLDLEFKFYGPTRKLLIKQVRPFVGR